MKQQENVSVQFKCRAYLSVSEQNTFFVFLLRRTKFDALLSEVAASLWRPVEEGFFLLAWLLLFTTIEDNKLKLYTMKTIRTISIMMVFAALTTIAAAQTQPDEYLGLPGDNLNLYAVLNLFQESETLEAFERSLNDKENTINNLDLNGDNYIDYISVSDYVDDNIHNIVLRTFLNSDEQQDIAVFVVEKLQNGDVQVQLIGDEALYGANYIVEPIYAETPNPGYTGNVVVTAPGYYVVTSWPIVAYMYDHRYRPWRSTWYWNYYPSYWTSWTPHYWHYYYGYHSHWHNHYYSHYRHWDHFRCRSYNTFYRTRVRVYSPTVVVNINRGRYRNTYSQPSQRSAGERHYAQTASRRSDSRQTSVTTRSRTTTSQRNENAVRSSAARSSIQRGTTSVQSRSSQSRGNATVNRSTGQRNSAAVSRNSIQRGTTPVQSRSSQSRGNATVSRSSSQSSKPAVSRSSSQSRSKPAVSRSSSQSRSKPAVSRSSSQSRSKPAVSRSSSQSRSKASVSRSSSSRSTAKKSAGRTSKSSSKSSRR